jgi:hypothetical protein
MNLRISIVVFGLLIAAFPVSAANTYPWLQAYDQTYALINRIAAPEGYTRVIAPQNSFQDWLRHLPLKPGKPAVYLYSGREKANQAAHVAVMEIDVGNQDLQQCADAIIRLRAEYLYSIQAYKAIHFNFTSGDTASFESWRAGYRPIVRGNTVTWRQSQKPDSSYATFRAYLNTVFLYAGTYSLSQELQGVPDIHDMQIGDVLIEGGFPGHAVLVVDMAIEESTGKKLFLLAQSFMPAQDIHILRNPTNQALSPWYDLDFGQTLSTPEWTFTKEQVKRFR